MKLYIKNLVNRLSQFSEKLDNIELFVDKKWVLIDEAGNQQTFIFERDGDLVMSLNGQVKMGKWKYYPAAGSIRIERGIDDNILLNQAFFDNAVMILKYDGSPDRDLFALADANLIPDLDIKKHLQSVINLKLNIVTGILDDGRTLEVYMENSDRPQQGMKVTVDGEIPKDGQYKSTNTDIIYELKQGEIVKMKFLNNYNSNGAKLVVEQHYYNRIEIGDFVYLDKKLAPSGKYKINFLKLKVVDGIVKAISVW